MKYAKFISYSGNLCYQQSPLLWAYLHGEKLFLVGFSIYMLFTGSWLSPLFNLHVVYRILTVSLFQFTCYLQDLDSLPFSIYMLSTESWQSPFFNLHVIYRTLTVSSSSNLHVIYMISLSFVFRIYSILSNIYMFKCKNLHDIYMIIGNM